MKHVKLTAVTVEQGNCIPGMGAALIVVLAKLSTYTNTSPINAHMLMMVWVMAHNQSSGTILLIFCSQKVLFSTAQALLLWY